MGCTHKKGVADKMMTNFINKIKRFIFYIKPRVYNCRDIWLVMWLGREYYIRK